MASRHIKICEQCNDRFFVTPTTQVIIFCDEEDAFFCSPYCRKIWLDEQFRFLDEMLYAPLKSTLDSKDD